ncbi:MAG: hypothetical protein JSV74_05855 [Dehalococcoidia bacterium]|nr:MAG: hypothetical protein JSV74_05855 [Dehalococcoidia bacterium]
MKSIRITFIFIFIFFIGIVTVNSCNNNGPPANRYLPPKYLNAIEMKAYDLVQAYQHPSSRIDAEQLISGNYIIVKDIEITEEIITISTENYLNLGHTLHIQPSDLSDLKRIGIGDRIDAVGICLGIPTGKMAVVLDQCIIESTGILPLPLSGSEAIEGPIY